MKEFHFELYRQDSLLHYKVEFKNSALLFNGSITNLLNSVFISDATNNANDIYDNFDAKSATVMFGQGFRFNVSIGLQF